ncbi:MAG TPA: hypothetical protein VFD82_11920 [Planctomycetota bacterium]|nr:hypothetical protein [Planctomycetota bacterium]
MSGTTLKQGTGEELKRLFAMLGGSISGSLGPLVGREIVVEALEPEMIEVASLVAGIEKPCALARGMMEKGFAGRVLYALFDLPDAVAMAGHLMLATDEVITERRTRSTFETEDAQAFGELGNVLFAGFGNVLREQLGNIDVRMQDHGVVQPGLDKGLFSTEPLVVFSFKLKVGEHPESIGRLVVDRATAEAWNKAPLESHDVAPDARGAAISASAQAKDDEGFESIPAAPIRGTIAAFVLQPEVFSTLRRSCRRIGFDLRRHGRGEIPNPAAHKNEVVLLDVPPGEDRRFDWCRRIKELSSSTRVVLLIHQPSRQRVVMAFMSHADVILGFPCEEADLSLKLGSILPPLPRAVPTA